MELGGKWVMFGIETVSGANHCPKWMDSDTVLCFISCVFSFVSEKGDNKSIIVLRGSAFVKLCIDRCNCLKRKHLLTAPKAGEVWMKVVYTQYTV